MDSFCPDSGYLTLRVAETDDTTPSGDMGVIVELESGTAPEGLSLPAGAVALGFQGQVNLGWDDGATDDQEPLHFTLRLTAIDKAGNRSSPVSVPVSDPGGDGGCQIGRIGRSFASSWLTPVLVAIALAWVFRGRRSQRLATAMSFPASGTNPKTGKHRSG
jgi:hypothetical protein